MPQLESLASVGEYLFIPFALNLPHQRSSVCRGTKMKQLKKLAVAAVLSLAVSPAYAQDWSGMYAGVQAGYGSGDAGGFATLFPGTQFDSSPEGLLAGAFVGYNWQISPSWAAGVEGDIFVSSISDFGSVNVAPAQQVDQALRLGAALRVRAGFTQGNYMPYAAIGGAAGQIDLRTRNIAANPSRTETLYGFTAALGVDVNVTDSSLMRIEFRHTNYGSSSTNATDLPSVTPLTLDDFTTNELRLGYALKF
ncbi:MAG: outer membrane beta-barrel protein [Pseudomonadota bacterium]